MMFAVQEVRSAADVSLFNAVLAATWGELYHRYVGTAGMPFVSFMSAIALSEPPKGASLGLVGLDDEGEPIASLRLIDAPRLPIEDDLETSLDGRRQAGWHPVEVDKFAMREPVDLNSGVLRPLFEALAAHCRRSGVDLLVCQGVEHLVPMYQRLGFEPIAELPARPDARLGLPCVPMDMPLRPLRGRLARYFGSLGGAC